MTKFNVPCYKAGTEVSKKLPIGLIGPDITSKLTDGSILRLQKVVFEICFLLGVMFLQQ